MTIVLTLSFGLLLETVGSPASVFAQTNQTATVGNQTAGSNTTINASTASDNATTTERFENITHGGGPGAGATNQPER